MAMEEPAHRSRSCPPFPEFTGVDGSGTVRLQIDRSARDARVGLDRRWRAAVGPDRLGAAVLEALGAASLARLTAWASEPLVPVPESSRSPVPAPTWRSRPASAPTREAMAQLRRARRDLEEFRAQLSVLQQSTWTVPGPGRRMTAVLGGGRIVGLDLDPTWRRVAPDTDLQRDLGQTLRAALWQCAALPERALEGCPDLVAVLAGADTPISHSGGSR